LCHRTVVAVQREIEMTGLSTVVVSLSPEASLQAGPPRILWPTTFGLGHAFGPPDQPDLQRQVLRDALQLLKTPMEPATLVEREYPAAGATI
jgi:D-proline reductase (dithiol) PrdB